MKEGDRMSDTGPLPPPAATIFGLRRRDLLIGMAGLPLLPRQSALAQPTRAQGDPGREAPWIVNCIDDFPPYCFTIPDHGPAGLDVEIVTALLEEAGAPYRFQQMVWSRAMVQLEQRQCDILFGLVPSEQRFRDFLMVGPFRDGEIAFAARADRALTFNTLEDLTGLVIGTAQRNHYGAAFDTATHFTRDPARSDEFSLRKLAAGRIDLVVGDRLALAWKAKELGVLDKIRFLPKPLSVSPHYIALPLDRQDKAQRLEVARQTLMANGAIGAIMERWRVTG